MKIKSLRQKFLYAMCIGISIFLLFAVITSSWIGYEVKRQCQTAQSAYTGDCIDALISLLSDESRSFKERNSAIWALGQLGDARALPVLESFYTGAIPEREPLELVISQYELRKAIKLAQGGFNLTALFWRTGFKKN